MKKAGAAFERVVADVAKLMDPGADIRSGEWVNGPDGRRDRDVYVRGTVDGQARVVLIECKDFDPKRTGRVGIGYVDALDSKRRDLGVDVALICSNAGFTTPARSKAQRVGIGLIGVMRHGDARIRIQVSDVVYTRKIKVERVQCGFSRAGSNINFSGAPLETIKYAGALVAKWVTHRVALIIGANPIVKGPYAQAIRFTRPLSLEIPAGAETVDQIDISFSISGGWFAHDVIIDSSAGVYDWLRSRVRIASGPGHLDIKDIDVVAGGKQIDRPPDRYLQLLRNFARGEVDVRLVMFEGLPMFESEQGADLDGLVLPEDMEIEMKDLPPEAIESPPS